MRAAIQFPLWMRVCYGSPTRMENYVAWIRDNLRTLLNSGTGNDFKVSDIIRWNGYLTNKGYAFIVEQRDGAGVATGNQWMLFFPYEQGAGSLFGSYFSGYTAWANRFGYNSTSDQPLAFAVLYLPAGGLRRSQVTLVNGTHTFVGGDVGDTVTASGGRAGVIESVSGDVLTIRHTAGPKWVAGTLTGTSHSGTILTEDWRSFPDVGWTNFDNLTLAADFSAPASDPYLAFTTFRPLEGTGAPFRNYRLRYTTGQYFDVYALAQLVFDNDTGFLAAYCSNGQQYEYPRDVFVSGDILENSDASTTWIKGACGWQLLGNHTNGFYTEQYYHEAEYYGGGAGTAGTHASFTERSHENFTIWNHVLPTTPQTFAESRVYLYDNNEAKGWINPDVVRIQGAANHCQGLVTSRGGAGQNLCIKKHDQMMTPWVDDLVFGDPKYELDTYWPPLHQWL